MDDLTPKYSDGPSPEQLKAHLRVVSEREANLIATIEKKLPDFAEKCRSTQGLPLILHQDAFAGAYQAEEYVLLGMAIKFAGITGKEIHIIGRNRDTLNPS